MQATGKQIWYMRKLVERLRKEIENEIGWEEARQSGEYPSNRLIGLWIAKEYARIPQHILEDRRQTSDYIEFLVALEKVNGDLKALIERVKGGEQEFRRLERNETYQEAESVYMHYVTLCDECALEGKPFVFP